MTWDNYSAPPLNQRGLDEVQEYNEHHDTGFEDRFERAVTFWDPVRALPYDEDVLGVRLLGNSRVTTQGARWLRYEMRTAVRTGQGGKGTRIRLMQVRPRASRVPFQPSGDTLRRAPTNFYKAHPTGNLEGIVFGTGSRNERWLIEAAGTLSEDGLIGRVTHLHRARKA